MSEKFSSARTEVSVNKSLVDDVFNVNPTSMADVVVESIKTDIVANSIPFLVPSNGLFYDGMKTVNLMPLSIGQVVDIGKVYEAKTAYEQFSIFVGIVNGSVYGIKTLKLTLRDFYALCYNLRIISYNNDPIMVSVKRTIGDREVNLVSPIVSSSIKVDMLEDVILNSQYDYTRVEDQLFLLENDHKLGIYEKLYFSYVAGNTPSEKLANFRKLPADKFEELLKYVYDTQHGLKDVVNVKLPDTGELVEQEMVFDYTMFFPSFIQKNIYNNAI